MLRHPVDALFIPAHTVPLIHSKESIVTIHGLEYEFCPNAYSFFGRLYMRCSIRNSCRWAKVVIAVSENTKKDLMRIYRVTEEKIRVIHEGFDNSPHAGRARTQKPFFLFIGRLEERKNICGIIEAFEILKKERKILHSLVLAGKFGYGRKRIEQKIKESEFAKEIVLAGT